MQLKIENMTCGGCVKSITRAVQNVDAAAAINADLTTHRVEITTSRPEDEIVALLRKAGYDAVPLAG